MPYNMNCPISFSSHHYKMIYDVQPVVFDMKRIKFKLFSSLASLIHKWIIRVLQIMMRKKYIESRRNRNNYYHR